MRTIYLFIFVFTLINSYSQNNQIIGHITKRDSTFDYRELSILLNIDNKLITGSIPDDKGNFQFNNLNPGIYQMIIKNLFYRDYIMDSLKLSNDTTLNLNLGYPPPCEFIYKKGFHPKCIGGHTDHIIPIVYGFPDQKTMKKAQQGKIQLGGCMISDCDPHYYCTIHKKKL